MSRDVYVGGSRSPRGVRLPTVDRSPSRVYPGGSPIGRKPLRQTRSGNNSPDHGYGGYHYYRDEELASPMLEERGRPLAVGTGHHRSRSATRPSNPMSVRYQSLDRGPTVDHEREFLPIRDRRDRSLERSLYFDEEPYSTRSARQSPTSHQPFLGELQHQNSDLQRELGNLKKELELTNQKLGSSMHSIKTFWSPELKKERALRKEESAKYSLINDQLKLLSSENQKQAMLVRQLEEELRMRMRGPSIEMQQQMEVMYQENEHLTREIAILRDTIKELELRIETQKQTLQARDESIKKLLEMLQNKGMGKEEERQMFQQMQAMAQKQLDEFRMEIQRRDQEIMAMSAKMKTLEEQHQDYQRHIAVLKESLCAKEEHYNMLQADVEELRQRLDEKNRHIEKKTQQHQQERARAAAEVAELREHMDIKDRKINVLQRKLELHEATKKLQTAGAPQKPAEDVSAQRKQIEEQMRQVDEYRKQLEEQKRAVDKKQREVQEKEKELNAMDKQLKKRKEQMDQLEASLQKMGGSAAAAGELNKKLAEAERNYDKAQEEVSRLTGEMERLLQLVQMSQEEQNSKEKTIMELQQALKNAQAKLKSQQQVQAQLEEQRKKEEVISQGIQAKICSCSTSEYDLTKCKKELPKKSEYIIDLESKVETYEQLVKDYRNEMETLETKLREKNNILIELENNYVSIESVRQLQNELDQKTTTVNELMEKLQNLSCNATNCDKDDLQEINDLLDIIGVKENRIGELEDALRESVQICTEREVVLQQEEHKRKKIMEKVSKLEQRLLSLQAAQAMRCHSCRPIVSRMNRLEMKLTRLVAERKENMQELANMKREALEAAISEKDAHLALLEMSGIRNARQADEVDRLKMDKRRLVERLQQENELSVSLIEGSDEIISLEEIECDELDKPHNGKPVT